MRPKRTNSGCAAQSNTPPVQKPEASAGASGWHSAFDVALGIFGRALSAKEARERGIKLARILDYPRRASGARRV
jgi:hypothetical protein